jgi:hypothetical protein
LPKYQRQMIGETNYAPQSAAKKKQSTGSSSAGM